MWVTGLSIIWVGFLRTHKNAFFFKRDDTIHNIITPLCVSYRNVRQIVSQCSLFVCVVVYSHSSRYESVRRDAAAITKSPHTIILQSSRKLISTQPIYPWYKKGAKHCSHAHALFLFVHPIGTSYLFCFTHLRIEMQKHVNVQCKNHANVTCVCKLSGEGDI